jgi:thiosulfate/3-mercaptopyruvate sulfurtransferase
MSEGRRENKALLVGTEWLADRLADADLRIVEVTPPGSGYVFAHLPGAVYLSLDVVFTGRASGLTRTTGPLGEVVGTLGRLGLSPDRHVVVYDANGGADAAQVF